MAKELSKVVWSQGSFNPVEIINRFDNDFPVLVKIKADYKGDGDTKDIKKGTVLCFSHIGIQKRAVAYDNNERSLSLPMDYPFHFEVKTDSGFTTPNSLRYILHHFPLPVTLRFDSRVARDICLSCAGNTPQRGDQFGELVVKWVYREKFLQGAYIEGDADIYSNYMVMPCHLNIKMKVGKAVKGKSAEYWETFRDRFALHTDAPSLPALQGSDHVFVLNGKTENEKQIYANFKSSKYRLLWTHSVGPNGRAIQRIQSHDSGFDDSCQDSDLSQRSSTGSQGSERMTSAPSSHQDGSRQRVSGDSHHSVHPQGTIVHSSQSWSPPSSQNWYLDSSQERVVLEDIEIGSPTTDDVFFPSFTDQRAAATDAKNASHPCGTDMTEDDEDDKHDYVNLDEQGRPLLPPDRKGTFAPPVPSRKNRKTSTGGICQSLQLDKHDLTLTVPAPNQHIISARTMPLPSVPPAEPNCTMQQVTHSISYERSRKQSMTLVTPEGGVSNTPFHPTSGGDFVSSMYTVSTDIKLPEKKGKFKTGFSFCRKY